MLNELDLQAVVTIEPARIIAELCRTAAAIIDAGERVLAGGGVDAEEAAAESDYSLESSSDGCHAPREGQRD